MSAGGGSSRSRKKKVAEDFKDIGVEFHDAEGEIDDNVQNDAEVPVRKSRDFEFTDCVKFLRLVRLFICLQVMAIINDSPSVQLPVLYRIVCKGVLVYTGNFYSRPVIDLVYFIEYLMANSSRLLAGLNIPQFGSIQVATPETPTLPGNLPSVPSVPGVGGRMLSASRFACLLVCLLACLFVCSHAHTYTHIQTAHTHTPNAHTHTRLL